MALRPGLAAQRHGLEFHAGVDSDDILSGVYYPTMQLPFWLQSVSYLLPLSAAVNLVRPLALGGRPAARLLGLAVLLGYCVAGFYLVSGLTRRRLLK